MAAHEQESNVLVFIVKSFRIDETGARVEFAGGHVIEYRREVEAKTPPSLPPLAKCRPSQVETTGVTTEDNVVPLRRVG